MVPKQNQTELLRCPPSNSTEGMVGLLTASMGYFTIIPDYIGFGVSEIPHPYMHIESLLPCILDFIQAGTIYSTDNQISLNGELFLTGYSEGGFLSLALQKEIEQNPLNDYHLTAVAPASGPYNLTAMIDSIFHQTDYSTPAYIAYFFKSYNDIYNWDRLDDFFKSPYSSTVTTLFNGTKTWGQVINQLPGSLSELLQADFVSNYNNGHEVALKVAIEENTILDWKPITPIHFFHGDADLIVPYYNVLTAIERLQSNGAESIELTTIPGGTHESSGPSAIFGAIEWFESL